MKPNGWNPNEMTPFMQESLKQGLVQDGWLASQALLVWGTDEKGATRNLIIDGEHRWTVAIELGMAEGPMVVLDGLTEAQAKALTIKLNQKRGAFDNEALAALVKEIAVGVDPGTLGMDLGFDSGFLNSVLGGAVDAALGVPPPSLPPVNVDIKGTLPNIRVPITFYVTAEEAERAKKVFNNPKRPTELRADLFVKLMDTHGASIELALADE